MNKIWLYGFGLPVVFGSFFVMVYLFLNAYLNPLKMHGIKINSFGEANIELVLLLVSVPVAIFLLYDIAKTTVSQLEKKT